MEEEMKEAVIFEFVEGKVKVHVNTDKKESLFQVAMEYEEVIKTMGLRDELLTYLAEGEEHGRTN